MCRSLFDDDGHGETIARQTDNFNVHQYVLCRNEYFAVTGINIAVPFCTDKQRGIDIEEARSNFMSRWTIKKYQTT